MVITKDSHGIKIERAECFSLKDTLECGQIFRFAPEGKGYSVFSADKHCYAEQSGGDVTVRTDDPDYFFRFFALGEDYPFFYRALREFGELTAAADASRGVRLLRQNPFEMIISFIISANNNIPRIKGIINRICERAGKKCAFGYAFPTREELCALTVKDFADLGAGYRAPYLYEAARTVTEEFIADVSGSATETAMKKLLKVKGVGPKVADCIMLFGLGFGDTFPVDVWMENALATDELNTNCKIRAHYLSRYGKLAGLAQQYIYHYNRNVLTKKTNADGKEIN